MNVGLILASILVFLYELSPNAFVVNYFFRDWGVNPVQLVDWL